MEEQVKEQQEEKQRLVGSPLMIAVSIDPHSGEFSIAHNATRDEQFKALANVCNQVYEQMNQLLLNRAEARIRAELAASNGDIQAG